MLTTPDRSHITPESEPKTSTMTVAELPTRIDVRFTDEMTDGPGLRAAQNSSANKKRIATIPKRNMTARRGRRMNTSVPRVIMSSPSTMSVQRTGMVSEPNLMGAFERLMGSNVSDDFAFVPLPNPKMKTVKRPTSAMSTAMTRVRRLLTTGVFGVVSGASRRLTIPIRSSRVAGNWSSRDVV